MFVEKNFYNPKIKPYLNFKSKVISVTPSNASITQTQKDFIDDFEDSSDYWRTNHLGCRYLGEGVCSKAYYSPLHNFVIKENKPNPYIPEKLYSNDYGTLAHENEILNAIEPSVENSQLGLALCKTEKGGQFLLSTLVRGTTADVESNPYTPKIINRLLRTLYRLDKNGIVNTDLSGANVLLDQYNQNANIIDYQWAEKTAFTRDNYSYKLLNFPEFEIPANDVMFERSGLAGYLDDLSNQSSIYKARTFLDMYLGEKSHFCEKRADKAEKELLTRSYSAYNAYESTVKERIEFERLKAEIFKNAPISVIDTEILKINMLKLQRKAYAFIDPNVITPRNVLMTIPYSLRTYASANELSQRSKEGQNRTTDPKLKKYFSYMERYGDYWQNKLSEWYPPGFDWVYKVTTGKVEDTNKRYFPEELTEFKNLQDLTPMLYDQRSTWDLSSSDISFIPHRVFKTTYLSKNIDAVNSIITNPPASNSLQAIMNTYCIAHADANYKTNDSQLEPLENSLKRFFREFFSKDSQTKTVTLPKIFNNREFWKLKSLPSFRGNSTDQKVTGQKIDINETSQNSKKSNTSKILLWSAGLIGAVIATVLIFKNRKVKPSDTTSDNSVIAKATDYTNLVSKGLKEKFGIDAKPKSLASIMGGEEFKNVIKKYTSEDFALGNPKNKDLKDFFKNAVDGKFRISLHSHSVFSDGRLTPQEFIDMAAKYADKVAKKLPKDDTRPPFIVALTDHDNFEGCQEIVKIIAQNPEKYKNLKFVSGAEMSVKDGSNHFDLTALGVNPFDENLTRHTEDLKAKRANSANRFIKHVNEITGQKLTLEELENTDYKGKKTLQNRSGVVYIRNLMKTVLKRIPEVHHENVKNIFKSKGYSDRDIPQMEDVIRVVKKAGGELSLTHPAKSFPNSDIGWFKGFLQHLKDKGVSGIEANHQYTHEHYSEISNLEQINTVSREFAQTNGMFLSGGTDSHKYDIFGHHHKISDELLKSFLE